MEADKKRSIGVGALLSYILLFLNTIYGLLITPYILKYVGEVSYGVYKSVSSLSATLAVMDLGLGSTTTRYMAKYNATKNKADAKNFFAMVMIQFFVIAALVAVAGIGIYCVIPSMYSNTFSSDEISLARDLVMFLIINMVLRMFEHLLSGVATGYGRFVFANALKIVSVIIKFSAVLIVLPIVKNVLLIVVIETFVVSALIVGFLFYDFVKLGVVPKLRRWDRAVFKESFAYTALMFVQTITIQFNGNVDNILIGAKLGPTSVTIYSMALIIYGMYQNLSGSIANVMLPHITKQVVADLPAEKIQSTVEKAGRYQFYILGAALGGFAVLGKEFFVLWVGEKFVDCYLLTLILLVPVTVTMMQNVSLSVLRAKNKMGYRTVTLGISCVLNLITSLVGLYFFGYWGAAIGTAVATVSNLIFMNIYYHRELNFKITRLFKNTISRTPICILIASAVTLLTHQLISGSWWTFAVNAGIFCLVYGISIVFIAWTPAERRAYLPFLRRKKS